MTVEGGHQQPSCKGLGFAERKPQSIFGGQHRFTIQRPIDSDLRVIPNETALLLRGVIVGGFVERVGALGQHEKSVGKSGRDPNLPMVVFAQLSADPPPERRR